MDGRKLTPVDPMPYGKHKGLAMGQVPADYLLWLYKNDKCSQPVAAYIESHAAELRESAATEHKEFFDARMPYGSYKGELISELPAEYLMACYESNKCPHNVRAYVKDNFEAIRAAAEKSAANMVALKSMYR